MTESDLTQSSFMVVDDDDFSRELIVATLNRIGCRNVVSASSAELANNLARQHRPDFVLLDIYMPGIDGWALLAKLRRNLPNVIAVMITGSNLPSDLSQGLREGVDGYCVKPIVPYLMKTTLLKAAEKRAMAH